MLRDIDYVMWDTNTNGVLCFLDEKTTQCSEVSRHSTTKLNLFVRRQTRRQKNSSRPTDRAMDGHTHHPHPSRPVVALLQAEPWPRAGADLLGLNLREPDRTRGREQGHRGSRDRIHWCERDHVSVTQAGKTGATKATWWKKGRTEHCGSKTLRHMSRQQTQSTTKIIPPFQHIHQLKDFTKYLWDWSTWGQSSKNWF